MSLKPVVDSREPEDIKTAFVRAGWEQRALESGDFQVYDSVGEVVLIERKSISQLLTDLSSGQLQRQARLLCEATQFPILLVEGHWQLNGETLLDSRHTWEGVWNALESLQDLGCRLQLTSSISHTIERVFQLSEYYSKEFHASLSRHPAGDNRIAALSLVHGIGKAKAKNILEAMPTLGQVANASVESLAAIKGVDAQLAQRIFDFWREGRE